MKAAGFIGACEHGSFVKFYCSLLLSVFTHDYLLLWEPAAMSSQSIRLIRYHNPLTV